MKRVLVLAVLVLGFAGAARAEDAAATYKAKCQGCHGADGKKKGDLTAPKGDVEKAITDGIPEKKMPAYKGKLSDAEIKSLAAFIKNGLK